MKNKVSREDLEKALNNINEPLKLDIIKGKEAMIGEVRTWNGKKYRKQANKKWVEVSDTHEISKKDHEYQSKERLEESKKPSMHTALKEDEAKWHKEQAEKLSDKEYDDTDFEEKEEKSPEKKEQGSVVEGEKQTHEKGDKDTVEKSPEKKEADKHFELDKSDSIKVGSSTLYRLTATRDSLHAKKGEKGGYVEKPENISGDAWVFDDAKVYGNAKVSGAAKVYGNAEVYGTAEVSDNACVSGNAKISGRAEISGDAWVHDTAQVFGNAQISGEAQVYGNAEVSDKIRVSGKAEISGTTSEIKKSLEDHFSIINAPLNFDKLEDIQKSDVYYAIDENNVSSQSSIGKFKKKGSELKTMAAVKKAKYETKKAAIEVQKIELASKIKGESGIECIEGEYGCKFNYNYDTTPQNVRTLISQYNNISYELEGINKDIKALNVIIKHCEDDKMYDVTARQLISLDDE